MKMNRFLSLVLAMVMSLALAAPALAAEPDEGIMPPAKLYSDDLDLKNGSDSIPFTTAPGYGTKLQIWFRNQGTETVKVTLRDYSTRKVLQSWTFRPYDTNDTVQYTIPTLDKACSYYLNLVSIGDSGARVIGQVAVVQYRTDPDEGIMPPAQQLIVDKLIEDDGGYNSRAFTTTPSNGKYIRVWFRNYASEDAVVMLIPEGSTTPVASDTAKPQGKDAEVIFEIPTPDKPCSYYVCIEATGTGGRIYGRLSAAQYISKPA